MSTKRENRSKKLFTCILILLILALFAGYYYYEKGQEKPVIQKNRTPQYKVMESTDTSLKTVVMPDMTVDILSVAEKFYGKKEYWPYIYCANDHSLTNPLNILAETVIRIPNIDAIIADKEGLNKAKILSDSIMKSLIPKPREDFSQY